VSRLGPLGSPPSIYVDEVRPGRHFLFFSLSLNQEFSLVTTIWLMPQGPKLVDRRRILATSTVYDGASPWPLHNYVDHVFINRNKATASTH